MPAKKKPVVHAHDGEWITIAWTGQHEQCCRCNAKHRVDYRVKGGKLQFRATGLK